MAANASARTDKTESQTKVTLKIHFKPSDAEVEVPPGTSVLDAALNNNTKIEHNCGGNCACSTCHIIVESGIETLNDMSEDEEDMLDEVEELTETSRLACQRKVVGNLIIRIPEKESLFDDDSFRAAAPPERN